MYIDKLIHASKICMLAHVPLAHVPPARLFGCIYIHFGYVCLFGVYVQIDRRDIQWARRLPRRICGRPAFNLFAARAGGEADVSPWQLRGRPHHPSGIVAVFLIGSIKLAGVVTGAS